MRELRAAASFANLKLPERPLAPREGVHAALVLLRAALDDLLWVSPFSFLVTWWKQPVQDIFPSWQWNSLHDPVTIHFKNTGVKRLTFFYRKSGELNPFTLSVHNTLQSNTLEFIEMICLFSPLLLQPG